MSRKIVVHQGFRCEVPGEVHGGLAHGRQQTQRGRSQYRCYLHPMSIISNASKVGVKLQTYANGLVDGLVIGFSDGIGGIWRFGIGIPTPLTAIWMPCKAQSTTPRL